MTRYDPFARDENEQKERQDEVRKRTQANDIRWVCGDKRGRRVLKHFLLQTGVMLGSYVPNDPLATAFREGQRHIGLQFHAVLTNAGDTLLEAILAEKTAYDE